MRLSQALVNSGVIFKQQVDGREIIAYFKDSLQIYLESWSERQTIMHMYKSIESYLAACFGPLEDYFKDDYFLASLTD